MGNTKSTETVKLYTYEFMDNSGFIFTVQAPDYVTACKLAREYCYGK